MLGQEAQLRLDLPPMQFSKQQPLTNNLSQLNVQMSSLLVPPINQPTSIQSISDIIHPVSQQHNPILIGQ
jgi:hypothetical protein